MPRAHAVSARQISQQLYRSQLRRQAQRAAVANRRAKAIAHAARLEAQPFWESLGYQQPSLSKTFVGFFTPIAIFIILLKLSMCWVAYTVIEDHLSYMERELVTDRSSE